MQTQVHTAPAGLPDPHRSTAAIYALRLLTALTLLVALSQVSACGGGGDDGLLSVPLPGVDCQARPELCT